jgi:hypothetical protein
VVADTGDHGVGEVERGTGVEGLEGVGDGPGVHLVGSGGVFDGGDGVLSREV